MGKRSRSKRDAVNAPRVADSESAAAVAAPLTPADRRTDILICAALVVAVFAVFGSVATHKFIVLDDSEYVLQNPHVASGLTWNNVVWAWRAFYAANWHPVTWMSHQLDVQLFGLNAGAHLLVNVALHAATTVLLFLFFFRATGRRWPAATVAALFALHPLHVESVAWVAERKDVLSAFFFALALLFYLPWTRNRNARAYAATLIAFALGLASKPMLVTFPFVLLLLDYWPLRRPLRLNLVVEKIPFFILSVISSLLTMNAQEGAMGRIHFGLRLMNAILSYVAYLAKAFWPANLAVIYPFRYEASGGEVAAAVVLLLAITAASLVVARTRPYILIGWLWFLGTLVPVIGIIQVGVQSMADRYTYLPLIGIFFALVWLAADAISNRTALTAIAAVLLVCLAVRTFFQVQVWRNNTTLFEHAIAVIPDNGPAHFFLGTALQRVDRAAAIRQFQEALQIKPADDNALVGLSNALYAEGDFEDALKDAQLAVRANSRNPTAFKTLGILELHAGQNQQALKDLQQSLALKYDPHTAAEAAEAAGNRDEAIAKYREALQFRESDPDLHNNLGALLAEAGQNDDALREYKAALKIDPKFYDAQMNLGALLSRMGNDAQAAKEFETAAKMRPKSSEPYVYLALIDAQTGRFADAAAQMDAAIAADPAGANEQLTNAIRIPFKPTNAVDYRAFLQRKAEGR